VKSLKPPRGFVAAGEVVRVEPSPPPFFLREGKRGGRQGAGLRYERQIHELAAARYSWRYVASVWFRYWRLGGQSSWCQPDGLLFDFDRGLITIVEVKLTHTPKAWWQLRRLYEPVVRAAFPVWDVAVVEVAGACDPHRKFPEAITVVSELCEAVTSQFSVCVASKQVLRYGCI